MKKNVIAIVAAVALVLLAVPTIAFANGMQQVWCPADGSGSLVHHAMRAAGDGDAAAKVGAAIATVRGEYVDSDNDGVCDNYGQGGCAGYVDADGDGVCDNCTADRGSCPGYVDADNDGVCDNYGSGQGSCPGYVDSDGDGYCDNYGSGCGHRGGNGRGYVDADNDGVCDNYGSGTHHGGGNGGHHGCVRR